MRSYRPDEVDFFAIYFPPTGKIYVVSSELMTGDRSLRFDPVLNGQQKLINWAEEHSWECHLQKLREAEAQATMRRLI